MANDILVDEKNLWYLGESIYSGDKPSCVIVGVGMNVTHLTEDLSSSAVSLKTINWKGSYSK